MGSAQEEEVLYRAWTDQAGVWVEAQGWVFLRTGMGGWVLTLYGKSPFGEDATITDEFTRELEGIAQRSGLIEE